MLSLAYHAQAASIACICAHHSPYRLSYATCFDLGVQKRHRNRQRAVRLYEKIVPARVDGLKRAICIAVGEKHSIALQVGAPYILVCRHTDDVQLL